MLYNHLVLNAFWGGDSDEQPAPVCPLHWLPGQAQSCLPDGKPSCTHQQISRCVWSPNQLCPKRALACNWLSRSPREADGHCGPWRGSIAFHHLYRSAVSPASLPCCFSWKPTRQLERLYNCQIRDLSSWESPFRLPFPRVTLRYTCSTCLTLPQIKRHFTKGNTIAAFHIQNFGWQKTLSSPARAESRIRSTLV